MQHTQVAQQDAHADPKAAGEPQGCHQSVLLELTPGLQLAARTTAAAVRQWRYSTQGCKQSDRHSKVEHTAQESGGAKHKGKYVQDACSLRVRPLQSQIQPAIASHTWCLPASGVLCCAVLNLRLVCCPHQAHSPWLRLLHTVQHRPLHRCSICQACLQHVNQP